MAVTAFAFKGNKQITLLKRARVNRHAGHSTNLAMYLAVCC